MSGVDKDKEQLVNELEQLRQRIAELEASEAERKRAEGDLEASEARYRAILDNANEIIVVLQDNMAKFSNRKAVEITGYSQEELTSRSFMEFVHPDDRQMAVENYSRRLKGDVSTPIKPVRILDKNGKVRWMEFSYSAVTWEGKPALLYLANDVTAWKKMEEDLRESEAKYRELAESITDLFFALDSKLRCTYWNRASEELTGIPAKDALGKRIYDIFPDDEATARVVNVYRSVLATKEPQHFVDEHSLGGRDYGFDISAYPTTGGLCVYLKDITERRKLEQSLVESEQWYRNIFDNAPFGIGFSSIDGKVVTMNRAMGAINGYSVEEFNNINLADIYVDKADREVLLQEMRRHGGVTDYPLRLKRKDGSEYDAVITARLATIGDREFVLTILNDVTERKRAEEQYQTIIHGAMEGFWQVDMQGRFLDVNEAYCHLIGYSRDELLNMSIADIELLERPEQVLEHMEVVKRLGQQRFESRHRRKDGSAVDVEICVNYLPIHGGRMFTFIRDITERRQAAEQLQHEKARAQRYLDIAGVILVANDADGRVSLINKRGCDILGYEQKEIIGKNWFDIVIPEKFRAEVKTVFNRLMAGEIKPFEYFENPVMNRKGEERLIAWHNVLLKDGQGKIVGTLSSGEDITERRQAEKELMESEARYRLLAENVRDVIWSMDMDLRFTYVSPSVQYLGDRTAEEVMSMSLGQLLTPSSQELVMEVFAEEMARAKVIPPEPGRSMTLEVELIRRDGSGLWAELKMNFMRDSAGLPVGILGVMRDITERKKAEEEKMALEQKAQLASRLASVGELSAGIAHEINNPLTGVIGYAELLMQEDVPERIRDDLKVIHDGAKRIADIVKGLLTFARQSKPERTIVDINQVIEVSLRLRAYELATNNIKVTTNLSPDLPVTIADPGQLQQVFLNLIINAEMEMKSAHDKGKLAVKTEQIDNTIRISFEDDGPGITSENLGRVFDPFFTTREAGKGTGLGLSICHGIVTEHKGRIYAESQPGNGATFIIELPIVSEKKLTKQAKPARKKKKVTGVRILVVDDEPVVRRLLSEILTEAGHEVEVTDDGEDALNKIKGDMYSLVLMDRKLLGMSGNELYNRIQEIEPSLAKRVVFITGDVMATDTGAFLVRTKLPYITKPFDVHKLSAEVDRLLARHRFKRTNEAKKRNPKVKRKRVI